MEPLNLWRTNRHVSKGSLCLYALVLAFFASSSARGDILMSADTSSCGPSSGALSGTVQTLPFSSSNGVVGITLNGNCSTFIPAFSSGGGFELSAVMSGGTGGVSTFPSDSIPIAWSFTPNSDVFAEIDWTVWVTINGLEQDFGGAAFPGDLVTGNGAVSVPQGGTLDNWRAGIGLDRKSVV